MSERHIDRLCAALNCKRPEPDTFREWGLRMARFSDGELDRMCAWIADNWEMARFPPVAMIRKAAFELGVYESREKAKRFERRGKCGECNGFGLVRVAGEYFVKDGRRSSRILQVKPFDQNFEGEEPILRTDDKAALRYERLQPCGKCGKGRR